MRKNKVPRARGRSYSDFLVSPYRPHPLHPKVSAHSHPPLTPSSPCTYPHTRYAPQKPRVSRPPKKFHRYNPQVNPYDFCPFRAPCPYAQRGYSRYNPLPSRASEPSFGPSFRPYLILDVLHNIFWTLDKRPGLCHNIGSVGSRPDPTPSDSCVHDA